MGTVKQYNYHTKIENAKIKKILTLTFFFTNYSNIQILISNSNL